MYLDVLGGMCGNFAGMYFGSRIDVDVAIACRLHDILLTITRLPMQVISYLRSLARYGSPGLSPASGFEHPASTLLTRFPAALDIGTVLPAA